MGSGIELFSGNLRYMIRTRVAHPFVYVELRLTDGSILTAKLHKGSFQALMDIFGVVQFQVSEEGVAPFVEEQSEGEANNG